MPYGIIQCYLPPGRGDISALTPAAAGTRFSDPKGMQGRLNLVNWLHTSVVHPPKDGIWKGWIEKVFANDLLFRGVDIEGVCLECSKLSDDHVQCQLNCSSIGIIHLARPVNQPTSIIAYEGRLKKVKVAHTRLSSVGFRSWSRFLTVSLHVTWVINPAEGCHDFPPSLQLPPQPLRGLLPSLVLGEQTHNGCAQFA